MKKYNLQNLSNDSLMIVMYFCDIRTISRLQRTSNPDDAQYIANNRPLWRFLCLRDFPQAQALPTRDYYRVNHLLKFGFLKSGRTCTRDLSLIDRLERVRGRRAGLFMRRDRGLSGDQQSEIMMRNHFDSVKKEHVACRVSHCLNRRIRGYMHHEEMVERKREATTIIKNSDLSDDDKVALYERYSLEPPRSEGQSFLTKIFGGE